MNARALFPALPGIEAGRRYRLLRRPPDSILPASPRPTRRDCHGRLLTALVARAGPGWEVMEGDLTPWASATFIGARHRVVLALDGEDAVERAEALAVVLPDADFAIAGHVVADLAVDAVVTEEEGARMILSVLTIEAW